MIKNILYVEDGSVDLDELKSTLTTETKIIVYRQGSYPPTLVQPQVPINDIFSEAEFKEQKKLKELRKETEELRGGRKMYYDINGVKTYSERMKNKYKNRKHPDNVFPEGITDAEFRKAIIDIFCGVDWCISYPGSQTQVNEEAIETILRRITRREFRQTEYYRALYSVPINLVKERGVDFKTACAEWWKELSIEDKQIIRERPNFDAKIFEEITGIKEEK